MGFTTTVIFYLLIGGGVSLAVLLADGGVSVVERSLQGLAAAVFWPLYLPILLRRSNHQGGADSRNQDSATSALMPKMPNDEMADAISQVERELDTALQSLDGWSEDVLSREQIRIGELRSAWHAQAARIRELDALLLQPMFARFDESVTGVDVATEKREELGAERLRQSEQARRENVERLRHVRQQMFDDLMGALAWVRELVTMIHLAKYTGAPASRAEELITQIAAAVEGLSEVTTWNDETLVAAGGST